MPFKGQDGDKSYETVTVWNRESLNITLVCLGTAQRWQRWKGCDLILEDCCVESAVS